MLRPRYIQKYYTNITAFWKNTKLTDTKTLSTIWDVFITSNLDGTFQKDVKMIGYQILKDIIWVQNMIPYLWNDDAGNHEHSKLARMVHIHGKILVSVRTDLVDVVELQRNSHHRSWIAREFLPMNPFQFPFHQTSLQRGGGPYTPDAIDKFVHQPLVI